MENQPNLDEATQSTSVDGNSHNPLIKSQQDVTKERKGLIALLLSIPKLADTATVVVSLLAGVGLAIAWLESSVNSRIEKRVMPFESYMQGVSFKVNEDFDTAIPLLEKAYNEIGGTLDYKNTSAEERYPVIEHYLTALANSENPEDHLHRMNTIVQQEATKITLNPYANMHAGWFYIRVGDPAKARDRFKRATTGFDTRRIYKDSAFCYYALMLLDLADGNADGAYVNAQEAANRSRSIYGLPILKSELKAFPKEGWFQKLTIRYPKLQETTVLLEQRL
jgi:tetratricopeptide (TPR) repeat protein